MPQGADYIFCLQDKNFNFYRVESNGSVSLTAQPYFLVFSPDGWNNIAIQNVRNKVYKSIDRTVSIPLGYVEDGARILKHVFYTKGLGESVYLSIASQQLDYTAGVGYGYWYKQIYRGEVDWNTFDHNGPKVTCTTLEDGLPKYLKANDKTVYEYPMNVPEAVNIKMDGIILHEKAQYLAIDDIDIHAGFTTVLPISFILNEGDHTGIDLTTSELYALMPGDLIQNAIIVNHVMQNTGQNSIDIRVFGVANIGVSTVIASNYTFGFKWTIINSIGGIVSTGDWITGIANVPPGTTYNRAYDFNITLPKGCYFGFYTISTLTGTDATFKFLPDSFMYMTFETVHPTSFIRGLRPQYVFNNLIKSVTDNNYTAVASTYLDVNKTKVLTCGNAIRGLDDAVMKISLEKFFKFWDSIDSVGLIDRSTTVDIGAEVDLIDNIDVIDVAEPAYNSFKISVTKDLLINEVEIGFPEIRNDVGQLNGNQEFNTKFLFSTNTTSSTGKLDKVSPIKCSCYEIEKIRITTYQKNTTDYKNDNDLYSIHITDTLIPAAGTTPDHYELDRTLNSFVTAGLVEPGTVYNLIFSPARSMQRNGAHLHSRYYKGDSSYLYFRSADKNSLLVCNGIIEKADINIGDLDAAFAMPIEIEMEIPTNDTMIDMLNLNPLQVFRFPFQGNFYTGILESVAVASSSKKSQQITIRSTATNDLTKLIEYNG